MEIPVYLFTGFLEAGKTKCIQETMESSEFNTGEKTLIIQCESGEEELDFSKFPINDRSVLEVLESEAELNAKTLKKLNAKHHPKTVLIEYNGMWQLDELYNALPEEWFVYQEIFLADCTTFLMYNKNNGMRGLVVDKLKSCELVVFNRADGTENRDEFHKIVRATSRKTSILYEDLEGNTEYDETKDPLPFDINADVIEISDRDYAIWYRDFSEDESKYYGKKLKIKGVVGIKNLPSNVCVFGRYIMTCCIEDTEFKGFVCKCPKGTLLRNKEWVIITATLKNEYNDLYEAKGPVMYAEKIEHTSAPVEEVATFF